MAEGPAAAEVGEDESVAVVVGAPPLLDGEVVVAGALSCTGGTRLAGELEPDAPPLHAARSTTAPITGRTRRQGAPGRPGR